MADPIETVAQALHSYARDTAATHGETLEPWDELTEAGRDYYRGAARAVCVVPGVAVVELPESWPIHRGRSFGLDVCTYRDRVCVGTALDLNADYARSLAAALLAAANAAEVSQ